MRVHGGTMGASMPRRRFRRAILVVIAMLILVAGQPADARSPCSARSCKYEVKTVCAGQRGKAKRKCKKQLRAACSAGACTCSDGQLPSCAVAVTTTTITVGGLPTTTIAAPATTTTTLQVGNCWIDNGDGTVHDVCTGLQWEKKTGSPSNQGPKNPADPHDSGNVYAWAGTCSGTSIPCQPTTAASAACAAATNNSPVCAMCAAGPCLTPFDALTTVWDWLTGLNDANFAGHNDWRLPIAQGCNLCSFRNNGCAPCGVSELESTLVQAPPCHLANNAVCMDPIFGPFRNISAIWTATAQTTAGPGQIWQMLAITATWGTHGVNGADTVWAVRTETGQ